MKICHSAWIFKPPNSNSTAMRSHHNTSVTYPLTITLFFFLAYCELRTSVRRNYAVTEPDSSYSPKFLTQSSEIDTIQKCMQQCVSRLDEDLPPSTDTCLGANFEYSTKTCRLVISPHNYMSKTGYAYIWVFYKCHQALSPGKFFTFFSVSWTI